MAAVQGCSWQGCDESRASLGVLGEMLGCLGDRADGSGINNLGAVREFETGSRVGQTRRTKLFPMGYLAIYMMLLNLSGSLLSGL